MGAIVLHDVDSLKHLSDCSLNRFFDNCNNVVLLMPRCGASGAQVWC